MLAVIGKPFNYKGSKYGPRCRLLVGPLVTDGTTPEVDGNPRSSVRYERVPVTLTGQRLDNYLANMLGRIPKSAVYRMIRRGEVRVNGGRKAPHYRIRGGDEVRIPPYSGGRRADTDEKTAEPILSAKLVSTLTTRILHEDGELLVIDKPAGLAVHGGSSVSLGLIEALRRLRAEPDLELIHRIDRDTSGCLAIARSRGALRTAQDQFRTKQARKRYELLVDGAWQRARVRVDLPLRRWSTQSGRATGSP